MCLMLYIGTADELPLASSAEMSIEEVDEQRRGITEWFSQPNVRFIGAHGGCSCGFPSVIADSPIDDFEGMLIDSDEREADLRSVDALVELLRRILERSSSIEIYPVWDGDQAEPPKGVIEWQVGALVPERFFVNERFMHVVRP